MKKSGDRPSPQAQCICPIALTMCIILQQSAKRPSPLMRKAELAEAKKQIRQLACRFCGKYPAGTIDHILPRSWGRPTHGELNIWPACPECNDLRQLVGHCPGALAALRASAQLLQTTPRHLLELWIYWDSRWKNAAREVKPAARAEGLWGLGPRLPNKHHHHPPSPPPPPILPS